MAEEIDTIGAEMSATMKTVLQLATLVALRTRERGQKEAEARVKLTQAKIKEAKELQARQTREAKAKDPRNLELQQMIARNGVVLEKDRGDQKRDRAETGRMTARAEADRMEANRLETDKQKIQITEQPPLEFDSAERRTALALHLAELGVEPELIEVRMLAEMAQGQPSIESALAPIEGPTPMKPVRERDARGRERGRER